jgi:exodeoxyribonuclease V gamma subunit
VQGALGALADGAAAGGCDEALDWQCVREFLAERLAEPDPRQRFLGGGVSFCGMVPLRAIPFRVIALLGMDDAAFPRREPATGINRLEQDLRQARRPGDRSVRDDDRYLFLQVLTSAADVLHLSWVGRDARTGKRREPSALVGELLRSVRRDYVEDPAGLVVSHPLQPFARAAFDGSRDGVFTYRGEWRHAASSGRSARARPFVPASDPLVSRAGPGRIGLQELIEFWRNPSRAFLRGTLHLQVDETDAGAEDEDALVLDGLGRSHLARSLVAHGLATGKPLPGEPDGAARVRFQLPVGLAGRDAWQSALRCAAPVVARVAEWASRSHPLPPVAFELALPGGWILDCALPQPCREGLLHWSASRLQGRNWLQPWIEHLALCAWPGRRPAGMAEDAGCLRIGWSDGELEVVTVPPIEPAAAREELEALLQGWLEGQAAPLPFFPRAAWSHALALAHNPDAEETDAGAARAARSEYENERGYSESKDPWIALAFRDRDPLGDALLAARFRQESMRVFGTLARLVHGGAP